MPSTLDHPPSTPAQSQRGRRLESRCSTDATLQMGTHCSRNRPRPRAPSANPQTRLCAQIRDRTMLSANACCPRKSRFIHAVLWHCNLLQAPSFRPPLLLSLPAASRADARARRAIIRARVACCYSLRRDPLSRPERGPSKARIADGGKWAPHGCSSRPPTHD